MVKPLGHVDGVSAVKLKSDLTMGLSQLGRGDRDTIFKAVHTSVSVALAGGMAVAVIGQFIAGPLLMSLNVPDDVLPQAMIYLRTYLIGMPVILLYNFEAAIFHSVGETRAPLIALAASGVINILLNIFFVAARPLPSVLPKA